MGSEVCQALVLPSESSTLEAKVDNLACKLDQLLSRGNGGCPVCLTCNLHLHHCQATERHNLAQSRIMETFERRLEEMQRSIDKVVIGAGFVKAASSCLGTLEMIPPPVIAASDAYTNHSANKKQSKQPAHPTPLKTNETPDHPSAPKTNETAAHTTTLKTNETPAHTIALKTNETPAQTAALKTNETPAHTTASKTNEAPAHPTAPKTNEQTSAHLTASKLNETPPHPTAPKTIEQTSLHPTAPKTNEQTPPHPTASKLNETPPYQSAPKTNEQQSLNLTASKTNETQAHPSAQKNNEQTPTHPTALKTNEQTPTQPTASKLNETPPHPIAQKTNEQTATHTSALRSREQPAHLDFSKSGPVAEQRISKGTPAKGKPQSDQSQKTIPVAIAVTPAHPKTKTTKTDTSRLKPTDRYQASKQPKKSTVVLTEQPASGFCPSSDQTNLTAESRGAEESQRATVVAALPSDDNLLNPAKTSSSNKPETSTQQSIEWDNVLTCSQQSDNSSVPHNVMGHSLAVNNPPMAEPFKKREDTGLAGETASPAKHGAAPAGMMSQPVPRGPCRLALPTLSADDAALRHTQSCPQTLERFQIHGHQASGPSPPQPQGKSSSVLKWSGPSRAPSGSATVGGIQARILPPAPGQTSTKSFDKTSKKVIDDCPPLPAPFLHRCVSLRSSPPSDLFFIHTRDVLGGGRFGKVHRCSEKSTGVKLAAKVINTRNAKEKEMALNEVQVMNQLSHANILQLYEAFETKNQVVLILEYVEGGELFDRIVDESAPLTEMDAMVFVKQICEGLHYMHQMYVLHLDLKPENILCVNRAGHQVKIIDFGLARRYKPKDKLKVNFGTPEFLAPEVVSFDYVSFPTDMWTLGVVTYMLLSGLSPFLGDDDSQTLNNVQAANWYFEEEAFQCASAEAKDFISNLLIREKGGRLSAARCLKHAWLNSIPEKAKQNNVVLQSHIMLRKYNTKKLWKKNYIAVAAANRLRKITSSLSLTPL